MTVIHAERSPSELLRVPSDGPGDLTLSQTLDRIDRQNLSEIGTINLVGEFLETSSSEFELAEETAEPFVPARQLRDVRSTDWAFEALQSLIERYDCLAGYPDRTYRGDRAMNHRRYAPPKTITPLITEATELPGSVLKFKICPNTPNFPGDPNPQPSFGQLA